MDIYPEDHSSDCINTWKWNVHLVFPWATDGYTYVLVWFFFFVTFRQLNYKFTLNFDFTLLRQVLGYTRTTKRKRKGARISYTIFFFVGPLNIKSTHCWDKVKIHTKKKLYLKYSGNHNQVSEDKNKSNWAFERRDFLKGFLTNSLSTFIVHFLVINVRNIGSFSSQIPRWPDLVGTVKDNHWATSPVTPGILEGKFKRISLNKSLNSAGTFSTLNVPKSNVS